MNELSMRSALRPVGWAVTVALALAATAAAQPTSVGLSTVRAERFSEDDPSSAPGALFGHSLAVGDFDGNGSDDLATGIPYDSGPAGSSLVAVGAVAVRLSTVGGGLSSLPSLYIRQAAPEPGDTAFGEALAACDFDHDGRDDLAIGAPHQVHLGRSDAGAVELHLGAAPQARVFFTQSTPGVPGDVEEGDYFGQSLACGDFDADTFDDLVVGVPGEDFESTFSICNAVCDHGMVVVIPGSINGLDFDRVQSLHQDVEGILGDAERGDEFGWALVAADFNDDSFDDLAIGVPGEDVPGQEDNGGVVQIVFGSATGLAPEGNVMWSQSFLGGYSESFDGFGQSLAAGDFDGNGVSDLVIGAALEDFGSTPNVGQVHVVYGFSGGPPDPATAEIWTQDSIFGAGNSEAYDRTGFAVAAGDFDNDGHDDLAFGFPGEYQSSFDDGGVGILMGTADGLSAARRRAIAAGFEGFPGNPDEHEKFYGSSLASGDFDGDGHADLAIGVPEEKDPATGADLVGSETVLYGSLFADGVENGDTGFWSETVQSPNANRVRVSAMAKLGPQTSKLGLHYELLQPSVRLPSRPAYVRVGAEAGFRNERQLAGSFFIDPQSLSMGNNEIFQMVAFRDSRDITRLAFDLVRTPTTWSIVADTFNEATGFLQFAASGVIANANDPNGHNTRLDYQWNAGNPGHLTMWRTPYVDGVPVKNGTVQILSVDLPNADNAAIDEVLVGMILGQLPQTFGSLFIDEVSFRR